MARRAISTCRRHRTAARSPGFARSDEQVANPRHEVHRQKQNPKLNEKQPQPLRAKASEAAAPPAPLLPSPSRRAFAHPQNQRTGIHRCRAEAEPVAALCVRRAVQRRHRQGGGSKVHLAATTSERPARLHPANTRSRMHHKDHAEVGSNFSTDEDCRCAAMTSWGTQVPNSVNVAQRRAGPNGTNAGVFRRGELQTGVRAGALSPMVWRCSCAWRIPRLPWRLRPVEMALATQVRCACAGLQASPSAGMKQKMPLILPRSLALSQHFASGLSLPRYSSPSQSSTVPHQSCAVQRLPYDPVIFTRKTAAVPDGTLLLRCWQRGETTAVGPIGYAR